MAGYAGVSGSVRLTPQNWLNQRLSKKTATNIYMQRIYVYTKASIRIMLKLRGSTFLHSYIAAITMSSLFMCGPCSSP